MSQSETAQAWRILDANANRAAEGMRTLDDVARLSLEDSVAAERMKLLRHSLQECISQLDRRHMIGARSADSDAGTEVSTSTEMSRQSIKAIVQAACQRIQQSIRQLEEFSKLVAPHAQEGFKRLRYQAYDQLAEFELRTTSLLDLASPSLYLLIDCQRPLEDFIDYIALLAEAGVDWFQIRDKHADGEQLVAYARAAKRRLKTGSAGLIINDRIDVAQAADADGVHLGQDDITLEDAQRVVGQSMLIGVSTHNLDQAEIAEQQGADYIGMGPTFASATKSFDAYAGLEFVREIHQRIHLPAFAIGGIDQENVADIIRAGCRRVAVSAAIHAASDPCLAASRLKGTLVNLDDAEACRTGE